MKIFSSQDELLLNVEVDDSSYRHRVIKGENNIVLKYSLSEHVELPVGSYCIFRDSVTPSKSRGVQETAQPPFRLYRNV